MTSVIHIRDLKKYMNLIIEDFMKKYINMEYVIDDVIEEEHNTENVYCKWIRNGKACPLKSDYNSNYLCIYHNVIMIKEIEMNKVN
jgi:hypothetical protein